MFHCSLFFAVGDAKSTTDIDGPLDTVRGMQNLGKIRLNQHSSSTAFQLVFACYHSKVL